MKVVTLVLLGLSSFAMAGQNQQCFKFDLIQSMGSIQSAPKPVYIALARLGAINQVSVFSKSTLGMGSYVNPCSLTSTTFSCSPDGSPISAGTGNVQIALNSASGSTVSFQNLNLNVEKPGLSTVLRLGNATTQKLTTIDCKEILELK